jgi:uncharacterized phiE125 gp8 family phage protein
MSLQVEEITADYTNMIVEADYQEYIRYDGTDQAALMPILIESAIRQAEAYCNATFGLKTYEALFSNVISGCNIYLPFAPILSVESVSVVDLEGAETLLVLNTGYYIQGLSRKYLILTGITSYSSILVKYTSGIATPANVNKTVKEGILTILSENFENREDGIIGEGVSKLPRNSKVKLAPFRNIVL